MTPVEQAAIKEYPDFQGPCDKPNMMSDDGRINQMLREAYVKGATEFCRTIWAQIHVEITKNCVGHYDDENISMATYANKLNSLANFCYEQYHEINEDND